MIFLPHVSFFHHCRTSDCFSSNKLTFLTMLFSSFNQFLLLPFAFFNHCICVHLLSLFKFISLHLFIKYYKRWSNDLSRCKWIPPCTRFNFLSSNQHLLFCTATNLLAPIYLGGTADLMMWDGFLTNTWS